MLKTYDATLVDGRVLWKSESPTLDRPVDVHITILNPVIDHASPADRGLAMANALQSIADAGGLAANIPDPVKWQQDSRADRPLPGRTE